MNVLQDSRPTLVDLTLKIGPGTPVYPGDPLFIAQRVANHDDDGYQVTSLTLGSHIGTHLDSPLHAFIDGESLDVFPMDFFYGYAAVLDLTSHFDSRQKYDEPFLIDIPLLKPFEPVLSEVPKILIRTDWSYRFGESGYYWNFPTLTMEAAEWLSAFPLEMLGLETPSLSAWSPETTTIPADRELSPDQLDGDRQCHRIFLRRKPPILLLEGLNNLDRLPAFSLSEDNDSLPVALDQSKLFCLAAFPLRFPEADGCPVRAVAILDRKYRLFS